MDQQAETPSEGFGRDSSFKRRSPNMKNQESRVQDKENQTWIWVELERVISADKLLYIVGLLKEYPEY